MERLGDSDEWGRILVMLLDFHGWRVAVTRAFAGGVLVIAEYRTDGYRIEATGGSLAEAASPVFQACMRARPPRAASVAA